MKRTRSSGFSLVEVLAAVAIIGIIVFIAIPNVIQSRRDAEEHFAISRAEALNIAVSQYVQANGRANAGTTWASKGDPTTAANNEAIYDDLVKAYLAYAPANIVDYAPSGYSFVFGTSPDRRLNIFKGTGDARVQIYY